jgi:hypothetical protein
MVDAIRALPRREPLTTVKERDQRNQRNPGGRDRETGTESEQARQQQTDAHRCDHQQHRRVSVQLIDGSPFVTRWHLPFGSRARVLRHRSGTFQLTFAALFVFATDHEFAPERSSGYVRFSIDQVL